MTHASRRRTSRQLAITDVAAILLLVVAVGSISKNQYVAIGVFSVFISVVLLWIGLNYQFRPAVVIVTPDELIARNSLGFSHRIAVGRVKSIDLRPRRLRQSVPINVPYVTMVNGKGFWLEALIGNAIDRPANPEQLELLRQLRLAVGVGGAD